ncbi:sensor histidine kinase [Paenibacillus silviterrae]|uniref:sensor histidine kinase n=1 Tax=Paenibacillus silviterrae TaxID=3242194 RepID=UPI002543D5BE|nr:histidine kinase [Paenibacillus chinjuensis]
MKNIAKPKVKKASKLFYRISLPMFGLIVVIIALFTSAASYILIRIQNDHSLRMAEQSMKFVYRNVWYQFETMSNVAAFVLSNQSIDNWLSGSYVKDYEAVDDYFSLQTNLQNLSLLSLLNNFVPEHAAKSSYTVSVALEPSSGLYNLAPEQIQPITGIFRSRMMTNEAWYLRLNRQVSPSVWWGGKQENHTMIYSAYRKTSNYKGDNLATVIIGSDTQSIKGVFGNAPIEKGYHLLLDESNRVIFSDRHPFLQSLADLSFVQSISGSSGMQLASIDGEQHVVMHELFGNGWKLLAIVPESHISRYTYAISLIGLAIAAVGLLLSGLWLRRVVVRVTVPIARLVNAMQRKEVIECQEPLPRQETRIYEIDALGEKFASMLMTIRNLVEKSFAEEMEKKELQLELLQTQINPHFLYNTLDLINCRAIMTGDKDTSRVVRSLANMFRYGLNKGKTWISLEDELRQVEAYLDIQKMMVNELTVRYSIPNELRDARVIHLILQPLTENCIVHGFGQRSDRCEISISARVEDDRLHLRVEDNGGGADAEMLNRRLRAAGDLKDDLAEGGYGTLNVHRRIALHCPGEYGVKYIPVPNGTCVDVVLPLQLGMPDDDSAEYDR